MADYQKMYAVLCSAVDEVIDPLERIPLALSSARYSAGGVGTGRGDLYLHR